MLKKFLVFLLTLVLAAGLLISCGGGEEDGEEDSSAGQRSAKAGKTEEVKPIDAVRVSYQTTVEEQSARTVFQMEMSGAELGSNGGEVPMDFTMKSEGVVDFTGQKSLMKMDMGRIGAMEIRQIGNTAYQKMPEEMLAQMPGAKPWIKMNLDDFYEEQYGVSLSEMQTGNPTDPTQQLEYLKDAGSVEEIGTEEIRGVDTTHYRAVVDLRKEAKLNGDPEVQKAYEKIRATISTDKLPTEVWLDGKERIRRYELDMPMEMEVPVDPSAPDGASQKLRAKISMKSEMFDFGVPVNVSPPPPEKTIVYKEFQRRMQQQMESLEGQTTPASKS